MQDDNWELINGQDAHDIEVLNYTNQINVIEAMLKLFLNRGGATEHGCPLVPNCQTLRELHRTGTLFLLHRPGEYRGEPVYVVKNDGTLVYTPPAAEEVDDHMAKFEEELGGTWGAPPITVAAFALWRINWIHPFKNGNGRTARAFAYACLCLKFGFLLPGTKTVIDLIMVNRPEYQDALRVADKTFAEAGIPDLSKMEEFLTRLLVEQLSSTEPPEAEADPAAPR